MSPEGFAKHVGIAENCGFAYGAKQFTHGCFWFAQGNIWFTHGLHILKNHVPDAMTFVNT